MIFSYKPINTKDISLIKKWLKQPYIAKWFGDLKEWVDEIEQNVTKSEWVWYFLAILDSNPVGFVQYYDTSKAPKGEWSNQPPGTLGIDYCIGEPNLLGEGYGKTLIKEFIDFIKRNENPPRIIADPVLENVPSCKVLEKCGFEYNSESKLYILLVKK